MTTDDTLDGKYRMGGLLGRGGMGAVHTATHLGTGRVVAIKVIRGGALDHTSLSRFARETRAVGALDTQHIVQVLDSGTDAETGTPYMVMEHLRGEDLRQLLDRVGALSPDVTLRIAAQVCLGLQKAHEAGVIHRDIKPANLYLARRDAGEVVVKILDFGVAKIVEVPGDQAEVTGLTNTGGMLGSPRYMSPEQVRAARNVDHRTDIWSLGVVLYRCLTGTPAYSASSSIIDLAMEICAAPPRPVQDVAPWIPAEVAALVHRTLQLAPEDRLADMGAMLDAIKPLLPGGWALREDMLVPLDAAVRAEVAPRFEHVPRADTTGSLAGAESTAKPSLAARALSRRTWALAAGAAVVAVVGALALRRPAAPRAAESAPSAPIAFSAAPSAKLPPSSTVVDDAPPPPPPPAPRRVRLEITPRNAAVEVDGVATVVEGGSVEIVGSLGSVHRVRVFKGKSEIAGDVVVAESGAVPARMELPIPRAGPAKARKIAEEWR